MNRPLTVEEFMAKLQTTIGGDVALVRTRDGWYHIAVSLGTEGFDILAQGETPEAALFFAKDSRMIRDQMIRQDLKKI